MADDTARYLVTKIALATKGALLVKHPPTVVAEAFIASRNAARSAFGIGNACSRRGNNPRRCDSPIRRLPAAVCSVSIAELLGSA